MSKYSGSSSFRKPVQRRALGSLFCVLILFYIVFHTVSGERGVLALMRETGRLDSLKIELANAKKERESLENMVKKLSDNSLDIDLLDERSRIVLGMSGKNEVVVFLHDSSSVNN